MALAASDERITIGRGIDYKPVTADGPTFDEMKNSMLRRREIGWEIAEQLVTPQELAAGEGSRLATSLETNEGERDEEGWPENRPESQTAIG